MKSAARLDQLVGPGSHPTGAALLVGPAGRGRMGVIVASMAAALARGERVVFLLAGSSRKTLESMEAFGLDPWPALRAGQLKVFEIESSAPEVALSKGLKPLAEALQEECGEDGHVIIDPISALLPRGLGESDLRKLVEDCLAPLDRQGEAVLMTVDGLELAQRPGLAPALVGLCGAYLELSLSHTTSAGERAASYVLRATKPGRMRSSITRLHVQIGPDGLSVASPGTDARGPQATHVQSERRLRILVADPDARELERVEGWLGGCYEVTCATDAPSTMRLACRWDPDLMILSPNLPGLPQFDILRILRGAGIQTPLLGTASSMGASLDRVRPLMLGADEVLSKPFDRGELESCLARWLPRGSRARSRPMASEAALLFLAQSPTRILCEAAFREHVERSLELGKRHGISSTLLSIQTQDPEGFGRLAKQLDDLLRVEDALLCLGPANGLVLLNGAPVTHAAPAVERLTRAIERRARSPHELAILAWRPLPVTETVLAPPWPQAHGGHQDRPGRSPR